MVCVDIDDTFNASENVLQDIAIEIYHRSIVDDGHEDEEERRAAGHDVKTKPKDVKTSKKRRFHIIGSAVKRLFKCIDTETISIEKA